MELIVIDGGSTDGSVDIIRRFSWAITHWTSEPDNGIYDAWNKGLRIAKGEWIAFLGADDFWKSESAIASLMDAATYPQVNFVSARLIKAAYGNNPERAFGERWSKRKIRQHMSIAHSGMLHHRSLFDQFGGFDTRFRIAGDYEFFLRAANGVRAAYVDEIVGVMGGGGVSSTQLRRVRNESCSALFHAKSAGPFWAFLFFLRFTLRHTLGMRVRRTPQ